MSEETCIECKERPVDVKKRGLCYACYQRLRKGTGLTPIYVAIANNREFHFVKSYFTHNNWTHTPAVFYLGKTKYTPDFYDGERNVFIEVSGSRQAYHQNKAKYELFKKTFPKIKLEIRTPDGELLSKDTNGIIEWDNIQLKII